MECVPKNDNLDPKQCFALDKRRRAASFCARSGPVCPSAEPLCSMQMPNVGGKTIQSSTVPRSSDAQTQTCSVMTPVAIAALPCFHHGYTYASLCYLCDIARSHSAKRAFDAYGQLVNEPNNGAATRDSHPLQYVLDDTDVATENDLNRWQDSWFPQPSGQVDEMDNDLIDASFLVALKNWKPKCYRFSSAKTPSTVLDFTSSLGDDGDQQLDTPKFAGCGALPPIPEFPFPVEVAVELPVSCVNDDVAKQPQSLAFGGDVAGCAQPHLRSCPQLRNGGKVRRKACSRVLSNINDERAAQSMLVVRKACDAFNDGDSLSFRSFLSQMISLFPNPRDAFSKRNGKCLHILYNDVGRNFGPCPRSSNEWCQFVEAMVSMEEMFFPPRSQP